MWPTWNAHTRDTSSYHDQRKAFGCIRSVRGGIATIPHYQNHSSCLLHAPLLCCSLQRVQKKSAASQTHCCSVPAGDHERVKSHVGCTQYMHATKSACVQQAPASTQTPASILQEPAEVVQVYRHPGLSKSAAAALLRKVTPSGYLSLCLMGLLPCTQHTQTIVVANRCSKQ